jgi:hypothetical protein
LAVSRGSIEVYFHQLTGMAHGIPAHFVFNVDEISHQELADGEGKICYVPLEHVDRKVLFPAPPSGKRIILVLCIGADGSFLKRVILIPRKTIDAGMALTGITDKKVAIYS